MNRSGSFHNNNSISSSTGMMMTRQSSTNSLSGSSASSTAPSPRSSQSSMTLQQYPSSSSGLNGSSGSITGESPTHQQGITNSLSNNNNNALLSLIPPSQIKQYDNEVRILFESHTVDQLKTTESNTRYEIEDKKMQLRRLIGNRYRDLVEGSDSIVKMKKSCESISDIIESMQSSLKSFSEKRLYQQQSNLNSNINQKLNNKKDIKKRIGLVSRYCKLLIDITEKIWRSIDNNDYFEANVQYLKAKYLYSRITGTDQPLEIKQLLASMPIIEEQWLAIQQFPSKTIQCSREFLMRSNLSTEQYIGALSTLVLFDGKTLGETFKEFLNTRSVSLTLMISKSISTIKQQQQEKHKLVKSTLQKIIEYIKNTLYLVMVMFYNKQIENNNDGDDNNNTQQIATPKLLFTSNVLEINFEWESPYMYEALQFFNRVLVGQNDRDGNQWGDYELDSVESSPIAASNTTKITIEQLSNQFIKDNTLEWLDQVVGKLTNSYHDILSPIKTAKELSTLRTDILTNDIAQLAKEKVTVQITRGEEPIELVDLKNGGWHQIASLVSGKDLGRLIDVIEEIFLLKAESIIETTFKDINLVSLIQSKQTQLKGEDFNFASSYLWQFHEDSIQSIKNKTAGITPLTESLLAQLTQLYQGCVDDFVNLFPEKEREKNIPLLSSPIPSSRSTTSSSTSVKSILAKRQQFSQHQSFVEKYMVKENELREYMRKSFHNSIKQFCNHNQSTILSIFNQHKVLESNQLQEILFLSKLSKLFYKHILQNPNLYFLPTNQINQNNTKQQPEHESLSSKIIDELKSIYYLGLIVWIHDFVSLKTSKLLENLLNDNWSTNTNFEDIKYQNKLKSWEKHIIKSEGNQQTTIQLPFQPSSYIISYLFDISVEISKVSFNTLDKNIIRYIAYVITNQLYQTITKFLTQHNQLSKEAYIQLLLDVKYTVSILYGQKKITPFKDLVFQQTKDLFEKHLNSNSNSHLPNDIIELIESKIDPIDLILYKEYIGKFVDNSYSKTSTLFGNFTQIHKTILKPNINSENKEITNIMPISKSNLKFSLFSIDSIPVPSSSSQSPPNTPDIPPNATTHNQKSQPPATNKPTPTSQKLASSGWSLMDQMGKKFFTG